MFANFEVCKAGLISASNKRPYLRSSTGCSQCRRKKKKCDERLPTCSLCLRNGNTCEIVRKAQRGSRNRSTLNVPLKRVEPPDPLVEIPKSTPTVSLDCTTFRPSKSQSACFVNPGTELPESQRRQSDVQLENIPPLIGAYPINPAFAAFNLPKERRVLDFLLAKFEGLTRPSYISPKSSILHHALPIASTSPATRNALMACGSALLAGSARGAEDAIQAKYYQCKALRGLANSLQPELQEQNLSTILLLHIFEKISCDSVHSKRLHLIGARTIIGSSPNSRKGVAKVTTSYIYLVEALLYHIALSSTFSGVAVAPLAIDYISKLSLALTHLAGEPGGFWKESSLIGVSLDVFDVIFRSSLLRRQLPLSTANRRYAIDLKNSLLKWKWALPEDETEEVGQQQKLKPPKGMIRTGKLFRLGCLMLLAKILDTSLKSADPLTRALVTEFCEILQESTVQELRQPVHLWPLLVMGCAAKTPDERRLFLAPLTQSPNSFNFSNWNQGRAFLLQCWTADEGAGDSLGLDILLRDDLLSEIFI